MMKELQRKLGSRKLWLALAGVFTGVALAFGVESSEINTVTGAVTAVLSVAAYIMTEGAVDIQRLRALTEAVGEIGDGNGGTTD